MPFQEHLDRAIPHIEPDNDVAWMSVVMSPQTADVPSPPASAFSLDDWPARELDPDLRPSSFRLQFLRAWIAARDSHPSKAPGHA